MYKQTIYALTVLYKHMADVGPQLSESQVKDLRAGAHALTDTAPMAAVHPEQETAADKEDLNRARLVDEHIEAMSVYLLHLENF